MQDKTSMASRQSRGKKLVDPVFSILAKAKEAAAEYGEEKVVNATIGSIQDDDGHLATLDKVTELVRSFAPERIMSYAPIKGIAGFEEAALNFTFGSSRPEGHLAAIATPGGTGAIRQVIYNYADDNSNVLIPDWHWGPYKVIAKEFGRKIDMYSIFTEDFKFNLVEFKKKVTANLKQQDNLVIIFNTPAHNPTGFTISTAEWEGILTILREAAEDKSKNIITLLDIAYIDYAGEFEEVRKFFTLFGGLPENILVTVASSMSKSFLAYGMRCGALIGLSSSKEVVDEFVDVSAYSSRANWSNVNHLPQELLVELYNNESMLADVYSEREGFRKLVEQRGQLFLTEARESGLEICPYYAGFFIAIPCDNPEAVVERLQQEKIFAVPLNKGIRLAVCSIPTAQMPGLAAKIKESLTD
ncbi:aminotransferase class I/II-fold pyridoxal phosphate-dependent enzyme [Metallumcola ferriviriculae]|uniref:Aminotransferase class I/II-fold pyridoxal phosphate-dependent enzyme n=1 Tax=Metallumcola ferriviriculae TaxID=3039180 RepID=A0AAU0UQW5_9FIRM|nr:aminotransferase class I/II-fold pyridoxal phosphate-dependent enzyme [Desulfitibacteraceae bacterium MK1]